MSLRLFLVTCMLLSGIETCFAESHPSWWRYASPEATALVGIRWEHLRSSPFAGAITGELSGEDGLGVPDLDCLKETRQMVISSPALLAMATGDFPAATLRAQATRKGLKRTLYHDVEIWVTPGKDTLSIARVSDQLVLLGLVRSLQDAIDRNPADRNPADRNPEDTQNRKMSPLLARGAHYADDDLWVVAASLPDDLAGRFIPIDAAADGFEGGVTLKDGLQLKAVFNAASEDAADQLVETLKPALLALPVATQGIQVSIDQNAVTLSMAVSEQQLRASLRTTPAAPSVAKAEPVAAPAPKPEAEPAKPAKPQVVRIYGLDDGPREIVMR